MWNWGGGGGTEGFLVWNYGILVVNWEFFGVELKNFGCWKGVVLVWNRCVELRGSVWTWGVLQSFYNKNSFLMIFSNLRALMIQEILKSNTLPNIDGQEEYFIKNWSKSEFSFQNTNFKFSCTFHLYHSASNLSIQLCSNKTAKLNILIRSKF